MQAEQKLAMTMHMALTWETNCNFIFESWNSQSNFGFIFGLICTLITSFLSIALPSWKKQIFQKLFRQGHKKVSFDEIEYEEQKSKTFGELCFTFYYIFCYSLIHIATMMLVMTFNGFVILALVFGLTIGYSIFGLECDRDKNLPVNCCA